ncbi:hypothetical protein C8R47DRAFT_1212829 [Mycena vitilis]|nr:hypothetical protein C8R47DRAFT_1212829 [Mycena vitilis]
MGKDKTHRKSGRKEQKKKKKRVEPEEEEGSLEGHQVTENHDGSLSCACREFKATGKACVEILAMRLYLEFGPAAPYLGKDDIDVHGPTAKGKGKQKKGSGPGRTGQRAPADHRIDKDHDEFLERQDKGWKAFSTDEEFTDSDDDKQPKPQKTKSVALDESPGTKVSSGRPPASTPLHPGRSSTSPAKFSAKPGPKGKGKNSLLAPLNPRSRTSPTKVTADKADHNPSTPRENDEPTGEAPLASGKKGRPPPATEATKKKRRQFLENLKLDYTDEDLDILDIDWNRWASKTYQARADEIDEMANLLEALSIGLKRGLLVIGPSYTHEAELLRHVVDWIPSDEEPIDASGAPAFPSESVLKNAWLHSRQVTLKEMLIFHYDRDRVHWLVFHADLSNDTIECYEPLGSHGEDTVDIEDIVLIAQYFKPNRGSKPVKLPFYSLTLGLTS